MRNHSRPIILLGGFYALMAAHVASLLLNWESDTLIFRQRITQVAEWPLRL